MGAVGAEIGTPSRRDYGLNTSVHKRHVVGRTRRRMPADDKQGVELRVGLVEGRQWGEPGMPALVAFVFVSVMNE